MATTYTQQDKVVTDGLELLLDAEFHMEMVVDHVFNTKYMTKGEYLRFFIVDINEISKVSNGVYYDFIIEMVWYFNKKTHDSENMQEKIISPRIQRLLQVLNNNRVYNNGSSTGWHNLTIDGIPKVQSIEDIDGLEGHENFMGAVVDLTIQRGVFW
jgi:hypothetical protein